MIISFSLKGSEPTSVRIGRVLVAAAGVATLALALYRMPVWLDAWSATAVVVAFAFAFAALVLAVGIAVRGSVRAVSA